MGGPARREARARVDSRSRIGNVQSNCFEKNFSRERHVVDVEPLLDGVDFAHSRAEVGDLETPAVQNVGVLGSDARLALVALLAFLVSLGFAGSYRSNGDEKAVSRRGPLAANRDAQLAPLTRQKFGREPPSVDA